MTDAELRSLIIECLQKDRPYDPNAQPFQVDFLFSEVAEITKTRGLKYNGVHNAWADVRNGPERLYPNLVPRASDIVWDLIVEGVLRPGSNSIHGGTDFPYIHVTSFGKDVLKGNTTPYDPDGYLKHVALQTPNADPIVIRYLAESAETLRRNCLLSSTVMLGCASEKTFLLLLDVYRNALNPADQTTFDRALAKTRGIKQQHESFSKEYATRLEPKLRASGKNSDWLTALNHALTFVFEYFRDMRNSAGHPTGNTLPKEVVASHLVLFPRYLRVLYDLIEWIDNNKPI